MSTRTDSGYKSFKEKTAGTVDAYRAVKLDGNEVLHAAAGEGSQVIGFSTEYVGSLSPANGYATVKLRNNSEGTAIVRAAAACSAGDLLYVAANGTLTPTPNGEPVARALESASGSGSQIEAILLPGTAHGYGNATQLLPLGGDAITLTAASAAGLVLGEMFTDRYGNKYKLVQCDNVNGYDAVGRPMGVRTAGASENDMSDSLAASSATLIRGLSASRFASTRVVGWMLVDGSLETALNGTGMTVTTDGNVTQNQGLIWGASGVIHGVALGTPADVAYIGHASADDVGTTLSKAIVRFMIGNVQA